MARVTLADLSEGLVITPTDKYTQSYKGETAQCPLCGSRSKLTKTTNGLSCGTCSRTVAWE